MRLAWAGVDLLAAAKYDQKNLSLKFLFWEGQESSREQ